VHFAYCISRVIDGIFHCVYYELLLSNRDQTDGFCRAVGLKEGGLGSFAVVSVSRVADCGKVLINDRTF
jgi:hypothetical protein